MPYDTQPRTAVITGAAGGLGRATALALARAGWSLVISDRDATGLVALDAEITADYPACRSLTADVTDRDVGTRLHDAVLELGAPLRGLVNCAGIIDGNSLETLTDERWQEVFDVNVTSQLRVTRAMLPLLRQAGSASVVNLSSVYGLYAAPSMPAYCMSKAAVVGLSRSMAVDLAGDGIRVNALCPGGIDTPMPRSLLSQFDIPAEQHETVIEGFLTRYLIKRLGRPAEVADLIEFLLSDKAAFMTGLALPIDGGFSAW